MEMIDKRVICGCHAGCSTIEHTCEKPCVWPLCLTEAEHHALVAEVIAEHFGDTIRDGEAAITRGDVSTLEEVIAEISPPGAAT